MGLELFAERGFDETTVDDIAAAAGISRRTFFRYFPSKNELPWGQFDELLERLAAHLESLPDDLTLMDAVRVAVVEFNRVPADDLALHRQRMMLLLGVPTLVAYSTLKYKAWRDVIAAFAARRLGCAPTELAPRAIGHAALGVALAAYEEWLQRDDSELPALLDDAFRLLGSGFSY